MMICRADNKNKLDEAFPALDNIQFAQLSVNDGLSQVSVMDIAQDIDGFMWFATQGGLDRYDGKGFINHLSDEQDPSSPPGNFITFSALSKDGSLWVGTNGQGIARKLPDQTIFSQIPFYSSNQLINTIQGHSFLEDSKNDIWVGTVGNGLFKYNDANQSFENVWLVRDARFEITSIVELQNKIIVGTGGAGLWQLDETSRPLLIADFKGFNDSKIQDLLVDDDEIWIATTNGLWKLTSNKSIRLINRAIGTLRLEQQNLFRLFMDKKSKLWIGTLGQGIITKTISGEWIQHKSSGQKGSISNNRILSIFQDNTGVIWIGTEGGGLNYFDPYSTSFRHISSNKNSTKFLNDKMVYAIYRLQNGDWWIGTESGGINHWHAKTDRFTYYHKENGRLPHNTVRAILPWNENFWVATLNGLVLLDQAGNKLKEINTKNTRALSHDAIFTLLKADKDHIWIGSYGGLDLFDTRTNSITTSRQPGDTYHSLPRYVITALCQTKDSLWVGTFGHGLMRYSLEDEKVTYYTHDTSKFGSLSNNTIWSIVESTDGDILIATDGGGLNRFDPTTHQFKKITKKDGLSNNVIYGILQESDSSLWVSSNWGLSRISGAHEGITNFYLEDGIQGREFNAGAYFSDESVIAFGGINGVSWLGKNATSSNPYPPETKVVDFLLNNQSYKELKEPLSITRNQKGEKIIHLKSHQKMLSLEFRALHYAVPSRNHFNYRLIGLNNNWIESKEGQYRQTFTGLSAGKYTFEVFSISKDNIRDKSPERVHIIVAPPPWLAWWAFLIYLSIAFMLFMFYRRNHLNKLKTEKTLNRRLLEISTLKESLSEAEHMAVVGELASNIAHSIRNPLANIRTTAEIMETGEESGLLVQKDSRLIISEVDRLSLWIKDLLKYSSNHEPVDNVDIVQLGEELVNNFRKTTALSRKSIIFKFDSKISTAIIRADSAHMYHMFNSLFANAVDAISNSGEINLSISRLDSSQIIISLKDDGIGMSADLQHRIFEPNVSEKPGGLGVGLSLVKRITERHNAKISVRSKLGEGSTFSVTFFCEDKESN